MDSGSQLNTEICLGELRLTRLTSLTSLTSKAGKTVVIVGAGPAGLFAALRCLELGMKPIIVERGKPVEKRKYDIARLTKEHYVNPDSNWCFGEGGAGTYSDGKLYTRSTSWRMASGWSPMGAKSDFSSKFIKRYNLKKVFLVCI